MDTYIQRVWDNQCKVHSLWTCSFNNSILPHIGFIVDGFHYHLECIRKSSTLSMQHVIHTCISGIFNWTKTCVFSDYHMVYPRVHAGFSQPVYNWTQSPWELEPYFLPAWHTRSLHISCCASYEIIDIFTYSPFHCIERPFHTGNSPENPLFLFE